MFPLLAFHATAVANDTPCSIAVLDIDTSYNNVLNAAGFSDTLLSHLQIFTERIGQEVVTYVRAESPAVSGESVAETAVLTKIFVGKTDAGLGVEVRSDGFVTAVGAVAAAAGAAVGDKVSAVNGVPAADGEECAVLFSAAAVGAAVVLEVEKGFDAVATARQPDEVDKDLYGSVVGALLQLLDGGKVGVKNSEGACGLLLALCKRLLTLKLTQPWISAGVMRCLKVLIRVDPTHADMYITILTLALPEEPAFQDATQLHYTLEILQTMAALAVGETVILLHPPLPLAGVSTGMERRCQQSDGFADC